MGDAAQCREKPESRAADVPAFYAAVWAHGNLLDARVGVGDKRVGNLLHGATPDTADFPAAPPLAA